MESSFRQTHDVGGPRPPELLQHKNTLFVDTATFSWISLGSRPTCISMRRLTSVFREVLVARHARRIPRSGQEIPDDSPAMVAKPQCADLSFRKFAVPKLKSQFSVSTVTQYCDPQRFLTLSEPQRAPNFRKFWRTQMCKNKWATQGFSLGSLDNSETKRICPQTGLVTQGILFF